MDQYNNLIKNKLPYEIINKILENIDLKDLFNFNIVSKKMKYLSEELIQKKVIYQLDIKLENKEDFLNLRILCNECYIFKSINNYFKMINLNYDKYFNCHKCKYKLVNKENELKYIKHIIITFYDYNEHILNRELIMTKMEKEFYEYINNFVNDIYDKYIIDTSEILFIGSNYKNYKNNIFEKVLNNTKNNVTILDNSNFQNDYYLINNDKHLKIINENIKKISIPISIIKLFKKVKLKNIEEININDQDISNDDVLEENIINLIHNKSNILNENLLNYIDKDLFMLSFLNNFSFNFTKKINNIDICFDKRVNNNIENIKNYLMEIKKRNYVRNVTLGLIYYDDDELIDLTKQKIDFNLVFYNTINISNNKEKLIIPIYNDYFSVIPRL